MGADMAVFRLIKARHLASAYQKWHGASMSIIGPAWRGNFYRQNKFAAGKKPK